MKQLTKQEQIKNCKTFLKYWKTVPKANVFQCLSWWRSGKDRQSPHTCNTIACAGGWLPAMPEFAAMGVIADWDGSPKLDMLDAHDTSQHLFGTWLFGSNYSSLSDHEEVTRRFTQQIKELSK